MRLTLQLNVPRPTTLPIISTTLKFFQPNRPPLNQRKLKKSSLLRKKNEKGTRIVRDEEN